MSRHHADQPENFLSRRELLRRTGMGFGSLALGGMMAEAGLASDGDLATPLAPKLPHFAPKAKRVIHHCS